MPNIAFVGDYYGDAEASAHMSFVGKTSYVLNKMLEEAGIRRADCYFTDVIKQRVGPSNDIDYFCGPKTSGIPGRSQIRSGKYIRAEFASEVTAFEAELRDIAPNIVVALGAAATWATLGSSAIRKVRGTCASGIHGLKVLPTYHPLSIIKDWSLRPVTILDFEKALRESAFPEVVRPKRLIWVDPTIEDIREFIERYILPCKILSFDIETAGDQITEIGFAPSKDLALVIPITSKLSPNGSYWKTLEDEMTVWGLIRYILNLPCRKVGQNGIYDIHFLWRRYGIPTKNYSDDTMLLHHSLQPESPKGLDFLGSVYTNEAGWKLMRKHETVKRDE